MTIQLTYKEYFDCLVQAKYGSNATFIMDACVNNIDEIDEQIKEEIKNYIQEQFGIKTEYKYTRNIDQYKVLYYSTPVRNVFIGAKNPSDWSIEPNEEESFRQFNALIGLSNLYDDDTEYLPKELEYKLIKAIKANMNKILSHLIMYEPYDGYKFIVEKTPELDYIINRFKSINEDVVFAKCKSLAGETISEQDFLTYFK